MPNMTVPASSQRMFSTLDVVLANSAMGRMPFEGVQPTIYPGQYTLSSPTPKPFRDTGGVSSSFSGAVAASQIAPDVAAPKSSAGARAIWPNLR